MPWLVRFSATDARLGQFRQPGGQVDLGVRVVRLPADARFLGTDAPVGETADDERGVGHLLGRGDVGEAAFTERATKAALREGNAGASQERELYQDGDRAASRQIHVR